MSLGLTSYSVTQILYVLVQFIHYRDTGLY
jgi:hypothetical protein